MTPRIELLFDRVVIYFGDTLHLSFKRSRLLGLQSWRYGPSNFTIEYTFDGGVITSEYDDEAKWKAILGRLDEIL